MYTAMVGINVYPSSRNFKLFFRLSQSCFGCPGDKADAIARFNIGCLRLRVLSAQSWYLSVR